MKIHSINQVDNNNNIGFKRINKMTRYGITTLIGASSLFMLSNAIDSFNYENNKHTTSQVIDTAAAILGITGTFMSLIGLKKDEENSGKNRYR